MATHQSIRLVRERSRSLAESYRQRQEETLSCMSTSTGERPAQISGTIAAYDLALCSLMRLRQVMMNFAYDEPSEEQALRMVLDELTRECLFLGGAKAQAQGQSLFIGKPVVVLRQYHQAQAEALQVILGDIEATLAPVLISYVTSFMNEEQILTLDAQPYWSDPTRREAVAEVCHRLSSEGLLDETYALIANELVKIDFPRDIHGDEDRYRRLALPTHVRRLLVRDLLAFIAGLKVECFAEQDARDIPFIGCAEAAQLLLERRALETPVPKLSMRVEVYPQTIPLLDQIGLVAVHPEPCLLCSTHDGHCDCWQVTFPDGTDFGEATQTEYDRLQHVYTFTPILPGGMPAGWCLYLGYSGIWEPDRPWSLFVFEPSEDRAN